MASAYDGTIDQFKDLIWDNLVDAAILKLFAAIPWLSWGPIGWLVRWIIAQFTDQFYKAVSTFIALEAIAFSNEQAFKKYKADSVKLYVLARDHGINSDQYREYRNEAKKSFNNLVRFGVV